MTTLQDKEIDFSVARPGTNVILVVDGKEIHVNKEFLSSFSPYFNTLLQSSSFAESLLSRVDIGYDYQYFHQCIQIVHQTGPLPTGAMDLHQVVDLMTAADRFDLPAVRRFCEMELMGRERENKFTVDAYLLASHYQFAKAKALLAETIPNEDYKTWFDDGAYAPGELSEHRMELHLTPVDLHMFVEKVMSTQEVKRKKPTRDSDTPTFSE